MSQHTTEYLVREITQYLKHSPEAANELLAAVAEGLTCYRQAVQQERQGQMQNSVGMLYSLIKKRSFSKMELACVLPSLFIALPKAKITGHSGTDVEILQKYLDGVKSYYGESRDDFHKYKEWIKSCHGEEVEQWFDLLIQNSIGSGAIKLDWWEV